MPEQQVVPGGATPPAVRDVEKLAQDILATRERALTASIGRAQKREIMSFGQVHDCDRNNFYSMAEGDQAVKWDAFVQAKLDAGKARELAIKRELLELGYEPLMAGEVLEIKDKNGKVLARGRTDLSLSSPANFRKTYPVEVKCMQTHAWGAVSTWRDLLRNSWYRKYVRQLMLYMKAKGLNEGLFLLDDFQGHWKILVVDMDEDFIADAVRKIERANRAVAEGVAPDRIPYAHDLCGMCNFRAVCIPDINAVPAQKIEGNPTLAKHLEVREAHLDSWKKVESANKAIKAAFESVRDGIFTVGNFIITRRAGQRKTYPVPDDVKEKYLVMTDTFKNEIERFQKPDPSDIFIEPTRGFDFDETV